MVTTRALTPVRECQESEQQHHPTPTKASVRLITQFAQDFHLDISQGDIFHWFGIADRSGWRLLEHNNSERRHHNSPYDKENRGRRPILGDKEFEKIEDFILDGGFDSRICGYYEIIQFIFPDLQIELRAIRRAFQRRGYRKCVTCQKPLLTQDSLLQRREYLRQRGDWQLS